MNLLLQLFIKVSKSEVRHCVYQPARPLRRHVREILCVRSEHARTQVLLSSTLLLYQDAHLRNQWSERRITPGNRTPADCF
jgi:hypothetical protein